MTVYVESDHVPQVGCSTQRVNHRMGGMGEENPNLEARNSKQILNSNIPMLKTPQWFSFIAAVKVRFGHLNLRFWLLFRISDLEFRIYPLISQKIPSHTPCVQQSHLWVKISLLKGENFFCLPLYKGGSRGILKRSQGSPETLINKTFRRIL